MHGSRWLTAPATTAVLVALALGAFSLNGPCARAAAVDPGRPVVVELFTSQGCSSCPPADRLLSQLGSGGKGGQVIPLAFHVDYWNHLGWSDPFSSPRWSARQAGYAHVFGARSIYTPQLVVNGRSECVGSQRDQVAHRIADAQAVEPAANVSLAAAVAAGAERTLQVKVGARLLHPAGGPLDLWVAVTQSGLSTAVGGGENASATLHDDFVVRRLEKAFTLSGAAGAERSGEIAIPLDPAWNSSQLAVVAFLQDPTSLAIQGAATQSVAVGR
jgi:hypothetical protein